MFKYFALIPAAMADIAAMERQVDASSIDPRAFGGSFGNAVRNLNEYGCWCYMLPGEYHRGKGQPQDDYDKICKILNEGYECAVLDSEYEGTTCVPWEVEYTSAFGGSTMTLAEECLQHNPGNMCAVRACVVEGNFAVEFIELLLSGNGFYDSLWHSKSFDPKAQCGGHSGQHGQGSRPEKACCGSYPNRSAYNTQGGDRKCCGNMTYNSLVRTCCDAESSNIKAVCDD